MGIQGLLPILKPITKSVHVSKYSGKKVAVDGYSWLHKGVFCCAMDLATGSYTNKHIMFCVSRVELLRQHGVEPVLVFDGGPLPMKAEEEDTRRRSRKDNYEKALALMQAGNMSGAEQAFQRAVDVSPGMARQVIEELRSRNVRCLVAPYEADAQMAYLALRGDVQAVVTEDSDLLVYGCPTVLFKLDKSGHAEEIRLDDLQMNSQPSMANFTHAMFQELCVMAGCDFLGNLPNIGIKKAHGLMKRFKSFVKVCKHLRFEGRVSVPSDYEQRFQRALWVFRHQRVYCPHTHTCVHLRPLPQGGLGAADVDVPSALPQLAASDNPDGVPQDDTSFLGSELPPPTVQGIAEGQLDPFSHTPFDLAALYASWPRLPAGVARALGVTPPQQQQGTTGGGEASEGHNGNSSRGGCADAQRPYTTLHELASKGQQGTCQAGGVGSNAGHSGRTSGAVARSVAAASTLRHDSSHGAQAWRSTQRSKRAGTKAGAGKGGAASASQQHSIVHMFAAANKRNHDTLTAPFIPPAGRQPQQQLRQEQQGSGSSASDDQGQGPADATASAHGIECAEHQEQGGEQQATTTVQDAGVLAGTRSDQQPAKLLRLGLQRKASNPVIKVAARASSGHQRSHSSQKIAAVPARLDENGADTAQQKQTSGTDTGVRLRDVTNLAMFSYTAAASSLQRHNRLEHLKQGPDKPSNSQAALKPASHNRKDGAIDGSHATESETDRVPSSAGIAAHVPRPLSLVMEAWGRASGGISQGSSIPSLPSQSSTHAASRDSAGTSGQRTAHTQSQQQQCDDACHANDPLTVHLDKPLQQEPCQGAHASQGVAIAEQLQHGPSAILGADHRRFGHTCQQGCTTAATPSPAVIPGGLLYEYSPRTTPKPAAQAQLDSAPGPVGEVSASKRRRALSVSPTLGMGRDADTFVSPVVLLAGAAADSLTEHGQGAAAQPQPPQLSLVLQGSGDLALHLEGVSGSQQQHHQPLLSAVMHDSQEVDWRQPLLAAGRQPLNGHVTQSGAQRMQDVGSEEARRKRRPGGMSKLLQHVLGSPADSNPLLQCSDAQQPAAHDTATYLFGSQVVGLGAQGDTSTAGGSSEPAGLRRRVRNRAFLSDSDVALSMQSPASGALMTSSCPMPVGPTQGEPWAVDSAGPGGCELMEVVDLASDGSPGKQLRLHSPHQQQQQRTRPGDTGNMEGRGDAQSGPHSFHSIGHIKEYAEIAAAALDDVQGRQQHERQPQQQEGSHQTQATGALALAGPAMALSKFACGKQHKQANTSFDAVQGRTAWQPVKGIRPTQGAAFCGPKGSSKSAKPRRQSTSHGTRAPPFDDLPSVFVNTQGEKTPWQRSSGGLQGLVRLKAPGMRANKHTSSKLSGTGSVGKDTSSEPVALPSKLANFVYVSTTQARA